MTKDEKQIDWVMSEVSKIINQASVEYGFDCAPTNTNATMFTLMNLVDKLKSVEIERLKND